ncbi:hypothetical protein E2C01_018568 [Portunus trituberculatus]|uniref:Uncharacterized protein n=1 Tax=Portunus trituberculatus TaxID=210409 RepID=A0A5B7DVZ5_PORTR|nr:hypothetical protein [Portunus trituberculatus]
MLSRASIPGGVSLKSWAGLMSFLKPNFLYSFLYSGLRGVMPEGTCSNKCCQRVLQTELSKEGHSLGVHCPHFHCKLNHVDVPSRRHPRLQGVPMSPRGSSSVVVVRKMLTLFFSHNTSWVEHGDRGHLTLVNNCWHLALTVCMADLRRELIAYIASATPISLCLSSPALADE